MTLSVHVRKAQIFLFLVIALISAVQLSSATFPQPTAPDDMTNLSTQSPAPSAGYMLNTSGGTITTININATTQNPHWKAYVGNITGRYALQDATGSSVFNWTVISTEGEIYATRKPTAVDWESIDCATGVQINTEEAALDMTSTSVDSIVNTFNSMTHAAFFAGVTSISANSCNATNLFVNSQASSDFTEVVLHDGSDIVYAGLIEDSVTGFDGNEYDFQLILPDSGLDGNPSSEAYYFYIELI